MKIDDANDVESYEEALAEYVERLKNEPCDDLDQNPVLDEINKVVSTTKEDLAEYNEIQKRHARYEYLKNLGSHKRTMQEEAELLGLKILISSEDQNND